MILHIKRDITLDLLRPCRSSVGQIKIPGMRLGLQAIVYIKDGCSDEFPNLKDHPCLDNL